MHAAIYLYVYLFIYLYIYYIISYLSIYHLLYVSAFIYLTIHPSIYLSIYLSIKISTSIYLLIYLPTYLSMIIYQINYFYLSPSVSVSVSLSLSIYLYLSLSISIDLYPSLSAGISICAPYFTALDFTVRVINKRMWNVCTTNHEPETAANPSKVPKLSSFVEEPRTTEMEERERRFPQRTRNSRKSQQSA